MIRILGLILALAIGTGCTAEMDNNEIDKTALFDSCKVEVEEYIKDEYLWVADEDIKIISDADNNKVKIIYLTGMYSDYEGAKESWVECVEECDYKEMYLQCVKEVQAIYADKGLKDVTVSINLVDENGEVMLFVDTEGNTSVWPD